MSITLMATNLCTFSPFPYYAKSTTCSQSISSILCSKISYFGPFSTWNGFRHMGVSISHKPFRIGHISYLEKKGRCRGKVVYASLFGVGAPEALVVGVVALLIFGPKGLAEVAQNFGKTLRTFQPTIRELQDVSRKFKSTLEKEIGLDNISVTSQSPYRSNMTKTTPTSLSTTKTNGSGAEMNFKYLKITEEEPLKVSASQHQGQTSPPVENQLEPPTQTQVHSSSNSGMKSLVLHLFAALVALSPIINTPVGQAIELQRGAALFGRACIGCHDTGGNIIQPGATLFLKDLIRNGVDTVEEIYSVTYNGKGRMPGFGESCAPRGQCTFGARLKEEDIKILAEFVKLQADGGWPKIESYGD